ncbi:MAG: UPF0147 family protein [Candidatus Marsarchaeota archaeon]|nr:UPF0147 family protein [Candidatus Marsarchaeota archaeon]
MKDEKRVVELITQITKHMDALINDTSVPKNVRSAVSDAKNHLNGEGDYVVRVSSAIYSIDEVSGDINLPPQARTVIWNILSMLESIKE